MITPSLCSGIPGLLPKGTVRRSPMSARLRESYLRVVAMIAGSLAAYFFLYWNEQKAREHFALNFHASVTADSVPPFLEKHLFLLDNVISIIQGYYVDGDRVSHQELMNRMLIQLKEEQIADWV